MRRCESNSNVSIEDKVGWTGQASLTQEISRIGWTTFLCKVFFPLALGETPSHVDVKFLRTYHRNYGNTDQVAFCLLLLLLIAV